VVLTAIGATLFVCAPSLRSNLLAAWRTNSAAILSLGVLNEIFYIAGNVVMAFAYLMAPVSLVLLANSYQAVFALLIGAVLSVFQPELALAKEDRASFIVKGIAVALTGVGTFVLTMRPL
jgi:hypothetical protein